MKYTLGAFAAFVSCLLFVQSSAASEQVGKVLSAKTAVYSSGNGGRKTLESGDPVFFLDRLSTNGTGIGEFVFEDGTKLAIGPSASIVVDQFVQKGGSRFQKFGVKATKGAFRWVSGSSPSSAYQIKTPVGTMGIRGTAIDFNMRGGVTHVVLLNGSAKFCGKGRCEVLNKSGDYISASGGSISKKTSIHTAFKSRKEAAAVFRFLGNPKELSSRFRVPGSYMLFNVKFGGGGGPEMDGKKRASQKQTPGVSPDGGCQGGGGGNCGAGVGGGKGNGTSNEGKGNNN